MSLPPTLRSTWYRPTAVMCACPWHQCSRRWAARNPARLSQIRSSREAGNSPDREPLRLRKGENASEVNAGVFVCEVRLRPHRTGSRPRLSARSGDLRHRHAWDGRLRTGSASQGAAWDGRCSAREVDGVRPEAGGGGEPERPADSRAAINVRMSCVDRSLALSFGRHGREANAPIP